MDIITLDQFIADIENNFNNFATTNDIDRNSIKGWVIEALRKFGKNICDKKETVIKIENSRATLPETFRSMNVGLRLFEDFAQKEEKNKRLIVEKQKIENPAYWSDVTMDYFVNYCESKVTTEKIYTYYEHENRCYNYQFLDVIKGTSKDTIAVDCLNLNPIIRNDYPDKISITKRQLNANFKNGLIYMQYNSLPSDGDEVAIPIISTGSIKEYIENNVKIKIAEYLIINDKNPQALTQLMGRWEQKERLLFLEAKSEANWSGINLKDFQRKVYSKNRENQNRFDLPR